MDDDIEEQEIANASGTDITYIVELRAAGVSFMWGGKLIESKWVEIPTSRVPDDLGIPDAQYLRVKPRGYNYEGAMALAWLAHAGCRDKHMRIDTRLVEVTTQWTTKDTLTGTVKEIPTPGPNAIEGEGLEI